MKKIVGLISIVLFLGGYSYFFVLKKKEASPEAGVIAPLLPQKLRPNQVRITTSSGKIELEDREGIWWVVFPQVYIANQEFVEKSLNVMHETTARESFPLEEDRFGFKPGDAFFYLRYPGGLKKRLTLGSVKAVQNGLYVLDGDSKEVYVVHNIWGQFLYYPEDHFYTPHLPIPGKQVKSIGFFKEGRLQWKVQSKSLKELELRYKGMSFSSRKSDWLWFFQKLRGFQLTDLKFVQREEKPSASDGKAFYPNELKIQTEKGNIIFRFDESGERISVPSFNINARIDSDSIRSLDEHIIKVVKSDKK